MITDHFVAVANPVEFSGVGTRGALALVAVRIKELCCARDAGAIFPDLEDFTFPAATHALEDLVLAVSQIIPRSKVKFLDCLCASLP